MCLHDVRSAPAPARVCAGNCSCAAGAYCILGSTDASASCSACTAGYWCGGGAAGMSPCAAGCDTAAAAAQRGCVLRCGSDVVPPCRRGLLEFVFASLFACLRLRVCVCVCVFVCVLARMKGVLCSDCHSAECGLFELVFAFVCACLRLRVFVFVCAGCVCFDWPVCALLMGSGVCARARTKCVSSCYCGGGVCRWSHALSHTSA